MRLSILLKSAQWTNAKPLRIPIIMVWEEYKKEFEPDGSLRDIYIKDTDINDWQAFVDFLRKTDAVLDYYIDGEAANLPSSIAKVALEKDHPHLLSIHLDGVTVNCHFFIKNEIKLDLDPKEIDTEAKANVVFRLMSTVGRTLNKKVILTPENMAMEPIFQYEPGAGIKYLGLRNE